MIFNNVKLVSYIVVVVLFLCISMLLCIILYVKLVVNWYIILIKGICYFVVLKFDRYEVIIVRYSGNRNYFERVRGVV